MLELLFVQKMGIWGFVLILVIVLLLFGGKKIPEMMKGLGKGVKEFKDASNNSESDNSESEDSSDRIPKK
ncbi:twin-arginine translocase TatA/TatE family subunit [Flavobacteriales bacterium]|jgi:sec-independent protein translocase protein TatA|nr:twin-arginine translocase TatA/TatE family subunit [Flavobacteriales bacterium]